MIGIDLFSHILRISCGSILSSLASLIDPFYSIRSVVLELLWLKEKRTGSPVSVAMHIRSPLW